MVVGLSCSPSPLIPLPSRERGIGGCCLVHPCHAPPLWIADQVRNDGDVMPGRVCFLNQDLEDAGVSFLFSLSFDELLALFGVKVVTHPLSA